MIEDAESRWSSLCDRLGVAYSVAWRAFDQFEVDQLKSAVDAAAKARDQHVQPEPHELAAFLRAFDSEASVAAVEAQRWINETLRDARLANLVFNLVLQS